MPFCNRIGKYEDLSCGLIRILNLNESNIPVPVPLKNVNLNVKVVDFVAQVTITQVRILVLSAA